MSEQHKNRHAVAAGTLESEPFGSRGKPATIFQKEAIEWVKKQEFKVIKLSEGPICTLCESGNHDFPLNTDFRCDCACHGGKHETNS